MDSLSPGNAPSAQGRLVRLPLRPVEQPKAGDGSHLVFALGNLVSMKGEDLLISAPTSQQSRFHRMRASVPSKLWRWRVVTGWKWRLGKEHINSLELRAILTAIKWRVEHAHHLNTRLLHLTDNCLPTLPHARPQ